MVLYKKLIKDLLFSKSFKRYWDFGSYYCDTDAFKMINQNIEDEIAKRRKKPR
jgi:hypothetical protein